MNDPNRQTSQPLPGAQQAPLGSSQIEQTNKLLKQIRSSLVIISVLGLLGVASVVFAVSRTATTGSEKYEYSIEGYEDLRVVDELESRGAMGWRVVSARRATSDDGPLYEVILERRVY